MRDPISRAMLILSLTVWLLISTTGILAAGGFVITESGNARTAIVVYKDASMAEKSAARELVTYLKQVSGVDFPIYTSGSEPTGISRILIGQSVETKRLLGNIDWQNLRYDGIIIRFVGNDLVLAGERPRGTLYAVYTFLEEYVGCRWWTGTASYIPSKPSLSVGKRNLKHVSPFLCRDTFYKPVLNQYPEFSVKLKLNGHMEPISEEMGGHYSILGFVHTFYPLLPPEIYSKDHPEWYSLINGQRTFDKAQLCLTNEEMKKELIKNALKWIDENPSAGMISISQNDCYFPCQCDKCQAVVKAEGAESGPLIRFVNSVAEEIEKKYPDFLVETLAYVYSRQAPKHVKPRHNVIVRLCSIECDFGSPLNSISNASFYKDLQDWKAISKRLYVWDYVVNYGNLMLSQPNWHVLAPNIRLFANNNVVGLFEQGDGYNNDSGFSHMKIWVMAHLMWNPKLDEQKLMREFANGYYGAAGDYLVDFQNLMSAAVKRSYYNLPCFNGETFYFMTQQDMDNATDLFDKAEAAVRDNPTYLDRVKIDRRALDFMWLMLGTYDRSKAGKSRGMDMPAICEDFISRGVATGNDFEHEGRYPQPKFLKTLRECARIIQIPPTTSKPKAPAEVRYKRKSDWVDVQEDKMIIYRTGFNSEVVLDPDASDGRAGLMPARSPGWASWMFLATNQLPTDREVTVYASIKTVKKSQKGIAFSIVLWDRKNNRAVTHRAVKLEEIPNEGYINYSIGTFKLKPEWFLHVTMPKLEGLVKEVYIDRFFFVDAK